MCGIVGFFKPEEMDFSVAGNSIRDMTNALTHRGPDDSNTFGDLCSSLFMGHRRLSIVDTSKGGLQPMRSQSGNLVIAFNGEIYNHKDLRADLEKENPCMQWHSSSDTETLLAAFEHWGIEKTLPMVRGMFAIALWDSANKELFLIRDRFGEKPLYYGWINDGESNIFSFASELKALRKYPSFFNKLSKQALIQYFSYMYVPCPLSIYDGIFKLEPGCILKISSTPPKIKPENIPHSSATEVYKHDNLSISKWYDFREVVNQASQNLFTDYNEASNALEEELNKVIKMQSLADVPLGAFLSGGVDSSAIVALMQKQNSQPIKTFTIGFEDPEFDESPFAAAVAEHLNTDHSELLVTAADAQAIIPELPTLYDEPFADYSQIPTYFVCKSAKQAVTVSLSGDAGDELFGGYNRYLMAPSLWKKVSWMPRFLRKSFGQFLIFVPIRIWDNLLGIYTKILSKEQPFKQFGDKVHKFGGRLRDVNSEETLFRHLISEPDASKLVYFPDKSFKQPEGVPTFLSDPLPDHGTKDFASKMMYRDTLNYLTDDILCKVDRAGMGVSLETRVPFLDHKIVELAWRMPLNMKINGSQGKIILRNILYKHVPKDLIERPKAGFSIPLGDWLSGPLKEWAESLLEPARLKREGNLNPDYVQTLWQEHITGKRSWTFKLWSILMFQSWLDSHQ
ncbi:asparagine synthase (glutamine-hydrolyzing) [Gammaproteobacteria bacterium]|nr:asparagine synthase (glutamine-hydrolyzing) [Gammaproteobacteria bacterium]